MTRKYTPEACSWLVDNYGQGDVHDTLDMFEARFGWRPTPQALYQKAYKLGLVKRPKRTYRRTCAVCHAEFDAPRRDQRRCPECIARCPKLSARQQRKRERV